MISSVKRSRSRIKSTPSFFNDEEHRLKVERVTIKDQPKIFTNNDISFFANRVRISEKKQGTIFCESYLHERLDEFDDVFLFEKILTRIDLSSILNDYGKEGGFLYDPRDMIAIWVYAYHLGVDSAYKISVFVKKFSPFIYLAGNNLISRKTISDFRARHKEALKEILLSTSKFAAEIGLIKIKDLFALDGVKLEADASRSKTRKKQEHEEMQKNLIKAIEIYFEKCDQKDIVENNIYSDDDNGNEIVKAAMKKLEDLDIKEKLAINLKEQSEEKGNNNSSETKLNDKEKANNEIGKKIEINNSKQAKKALAEINQINKALLENKDAKPDTYINLTDSDCTLQKIKSGYIKEGYNGQVISNNQVIVVGDITNEQNDQNQLTPMLENLLEFLNTTLKAEHKEFLDLKIKFAADAGYNSGKNLNYVFSLDRIDAYISMYKRSDEKNKLDDTATKEKAKFSKENFIYNEDEDEWRFSDKCSLTFEKQYIKEGKQITRYCGDLAKCIYCKDHKNCVTTKFDQKRGYRSMEDDGYILDRQEMKAKMKKDESKKIYSERSAEVEPIFGQIKNNKNKRRFRLRGIDKVKGEFALICTAHNIGKIMNFIKRCLKEEIIIPNFAFD